MTDQWARWRHALHTGTRVEWERGDVASGFFKRDTGRGASKPIEAIAIFRDDDGMLQCIRDVYGDGSKLDADQIEELFASCCLYPIEEEVYRAVTERSEAWPPEYGTRLTMKDQAAGVAWTPAYGRKRLGTDVPTITSATSNEDEKINTTADAAENPRAVIGGNNPPEELTPDARLRAEISQQTATVKTWLDTIGGKPTTKPEADQLADYATRFGALSKSAVDQHEVEKAPILQQGREIDAKWFGLRDNATLARGRCLDIAQKWMDAENARRAEEARLANEAAAKSAEKSAEQFDEPATPPAPVEPQKITGIGNMRTVSTRNRDLWVVVDPRAYLAHLIAQDGDLPPKIIEAAEKVARRRAMEAPGVKRDSIRSAA